MKRAKQGEDLVILQKFSPISVIRRWISRFLQPHILNNFLSHSWNSILKTFLNTHRLKLVPLFRAFPRKLAGFMHRTLAPLRRIVTRSLEVLVYDRGSSTKPQSFLIHDRLECGHEYTCLSWDIFDLLNAYTNNPEVRARMHRCHPCASLLVSKKPVQSVAIAAKAGVA